MKVLVVGATGFTGAYVTRILVEMSAQVACFVRSTSDVSVLPLDRVELCSGDLDYPGSLLEAMRGRDALVTVASLGFGHAPRIVEAARAAGIRRAVFLSSTSIFTTLNPDSKDVRLAAERTIEESGLASTILRPTMIYGSARDRNMSRLIRFVRKFPVVPVLGTGRYLQQPVYVGDVAAAAVSCLNCDSAAGQAYNISGAEALSFNEVVDTVAAELGKRIRRLHLPSAPFVGLLRLAERLSLPLPVKAEQVQRLNEDKAFDFEPAARDFGYSPRSFSEGIRFEIREMGLGAGSRSPWTGGEKYPEDKGHRKVKDNRGHA